MQNKNTTKNNQSFEDTYRHHGSLPPKHFIVYFLRIKIVSDITTVQLSPSVNLAMIQFFYLMSFIQCSNFVNCPQITAFSPSSAGSSLRAGITFSGDVSLASFNMEHFHSLKNFFYNIGIFKRIQSPLCYRRIFSILYVSDVEHPGLEYYIDGVFFSGYHIIKHRLSVSHC